MKIENIDRIYIYLNKILPHNISYVIIQLPNIGKEGGTCEKP